MGDYTKAGEAALTKAVRTLDQGDAESIPERLERVWDTLEDYCGGSFHAAEEMLLRWLLKNMTGNSATAERVRRYPRAWDILGAVFGLIPLFSLAKSLADRRFVGILQQTLKDIAAPQQEGTQTNGADSDVEMADASAPESSTNPRKRKRAGAASFDVSVQKLVGGCLQTAEAAFEAIRALLSRCDKSLDGPTTHRMGAEHVKSLFSTSAVDSMGILVPWLTVCGLALDRPKVESLREQSSWLSTFTALWQLHLQGASDASEVATHLSGTATRILGRLAGIPRQTPLGVDTTAQERWTRDLRRFLARNLILPARTAFLTKQSQEIVQVAVDMSSGSAQITFPVLFDLASKSPLELGGNTSRKDYETWVQAVFDAILHSTKHISRDSSRVAVRVIMEMAAERGIALSVASLRALCKDYALGQDAYDWSLLLSLVKLNPDVFLISGEGKELLEQILAKTKEREVLDAEDLEKAAQFIVLLADGYAQARDLATFIKLWLNQLAPTKTKAGLQPLWSRKELSDTVAKLIQSSLNANHLVEILEWLSAQTQPTESMARIHILEAISSGIFQEDLIDAANMKTFDGVFLEKFSKKELPAISACRWMVASKTMARGTLKEAGHVWSQIKSDIKSTLRKYPIDREDTLAAFKCCAAAWLANHPGAAHEEEVVKLICSFVERLEEDGEPMELDSAAEGAFISKGTFFSWMLSDAPRLLSLLIKKNGRVPNGILSLLTLSGNEDAARLESALLVSRLLLDRESNVNNQKLTDMLIDTVISMVDTSKASRSGCATKIAIQFLSDVPSEVLSRTQREAAMKALVSHLPKDSDKAEAIGTEHWKSVLSLMVKLMSRPTFYEDMSFSHLESIGRCLLKIHKRSSRRSRGELATDDFGRDRDTFKLLQQLAVLTIRQMTSGSPEEREKAYLKGAISVLQSSCDDSEAAPRIVLLQTFISTVQSSPAVKKLEEDGLDISALKSQLLQVTSPVITSSKRTGKGLLALLVALEALGDLDRETVRQALADAIPSLLKASDSLLDKGVQAGWEVRMFVANYFPEALSSPLKIKMSVEPQALADEDGDAEADEPAAALSKTALLRYVDAAVRPADEDTKLGYLKELLEDGNDQDMLGRLLVVYRLIQHLKARFDLSQAHSALCNRLIQINTPAQFLLTSKAIHYLLDQNPVCMTQWNIELTLSTVSTLCFQPSTQSLIATTPSIFPSLTRLVEIVIKRHRKRLDGHFHILVRYAGQFMYLVLMAYIKLQLEFVPMQSGVREALEPGCLAYWR
ncbi:hypothetical protein N0V88_001671 [Collariella sp. IMI 366227]|nr:hypothetical protein N0V88_001671 [Collariella sp. IMI 366227]